VYDMDGIDRERLYTQITSNVRMMIPFSNFNTCLVSIEDIYNKQLGFKNRVDIYKQYRMSTLENKNANRRFTKPGVSSENDLNKKIKKQEGKKYEIEMRKSNKLGE